MVNKMEYHTAFRGLIAISLIIINLKIYSMQSEDTVSEISTDLSHVMGLPQYKVIHLGLISFMEKEIRLAEDDIADLLERYNVPSKESLYEMIKSRKIPSHPAWEDYITWKNKEKYIRDLKMRIGKVQ